MDGLLLQTVEGLESNPLAYSAGEIWERLQAEKEEVSRDILAQGPLCHEDTAETQDLEASEDCQDEIEWHYRGSLEDRLREINDAQDRLFDGGYGRCTECGAEIDVRRLRANPAVSLCVTCRQASEGEPEFPTL